MPREGSYLKCGMMWVVHRGHAGDWVVASSSWDATFRPRRLIVGTVIALLVAIIAHSVIPRRADLTRFDPDEMARRETAMWRDYYEKCYLPLVFELYETARREQGFSPLDSARVALVAARAAKAFQRTTSRAQAEAAMPYLIDYFRLLARAAPVPVDIEDAARTELAWWQARREAVPAEQYGPIIARVPGLDSSIWDRQCRYPSGRRDPGAGDGLPGCACRRHHRGRLGEDRAAAAIGIRLAQKGGIFPGAPPMNKQFRPEDR
jgi:hypothetical protein